VLLLCLQLLSLLVCSALSVLRHRLASVSTHATVHKTGVDLVLLACVLRLLWL
jgi:hypothetical protein